MASRAELELIVSLKDEATRGLQSISNHVEGLGGQLARAGLMTGAAGIAAIGGAAAGAALSGFSFNRTLEDVTAQLNAFTKNGEESAEILEMIRERASRTPFAFEEMATATAGLMPVARSSGEALEDLVAQAEILAASNPAQGLEGAAFALREAAGGDFTSIIERFNLSRQTLNRLKEEGVPALEAVTIAMQEMGYDASLVTNMSETLGGRWSTFKDTLQGLAGVAMAPIFDRVSAGLGEITAYLSDGNVIGNLEAMATAIGEKLGGAFDWLAANADRVLPIIGAIAAAFASFTIISTVVGWLGALGTALTAAGAAGGVLTTVIGVLGGPLTIAIAAIAAAVGLLTYAWSQNWGGIQEKTAAAWAFIQPILQTLWDWLVTRLGDAIMRLAAFWTTTLQPSLELVWGFIQTSLIPLLQALAEVAIAGLKVATETLQEVWSKLLYPALQRVADILGPILTPMMEAFRDAMDRASPVIKDGAGFVANLKSALDGIAGIIDGIVGALKRMADAITRLPDLKLPSLPSIPGFAGGTNFAPGGLAWVGERGPELVELPRGSRVHTAEASRNMAGGITINLVVNGAGAGVGREVAQAAKMAVEAALREAGRRGDIRLRSA